MRGRTNGLTNGIVNGNGLVNGRGLVNGTRRPLRSNVFGIVTHKDIRVGVSLTLLFVLFLPSFYLLMSLPAPTVPVIKIDGLFADWDGVPSYIEGGTGTNNDIDFAKYALYDGGDNMYISFQVKGQVFPGVRDYDGFCAFVDADGNLNTGYWPGDLGAEYAIRVYGSDGRLSSATLLRYGSGQDNLNWSAWSGVSTLSAASSVNAVEFAVFTRGLNLASRYSVRLTGSDFAGHTSVASFRMGRAPGSLVVEQSPRSSLTALTPSSNEILHLNFTAQGGVVDIPDLAASMQWEAYPSNVVSRLQLPNRLRVEDGEEVQVIVGLDTSGLATMSPVWLNLTGLTVPVPLTITGPGGVGYIAQLPQHKIVDGWFGDWQTGLSSDTSLPLSNENVDIASYSSNVTHAPGYDKALFYVEFDGKAMAGSAIPARIQWMQAGQPSSPTTPRPLKRVTGMDRLQVFIDANSTDPEGCREGPMAADFRLEFLGHRRRVDSTSLYVCSNGQWSKTTGMDPIALLSGSKMEMSIDLSALGQLDAPATFFESTDWSGIGDIPPPIGLRSRSAEDERTRGADQPKVLHGQNAESVTSLPLESDPTLDGSCGDSAYGAAGHVSEPDIEFYVGHRLGWVWVCIISRDASNDNMDRAELVLDTTHNGTDSPQYDDRMYVLQANTNTLAARRHGTGSGWDPCEDGVTCTAGDAGQAAYDGSYQEYEFRLSQLNVWATGHDRSGFAIHLFNATLAWDDFWGSSNVDINKPDTWGHLDIPEFPVMIMPFLVAVAVGRSRRKRRRA